MSLISAQTIVQNGFRTPKNSYLLARLLTIKRYDKPLVVYRKDSKARRDDGTYHRLAILADITSNIVFAVVSYTAHESQRLFTNPQLQVGELCRVTDGVFLGHHLGDDNVNPIFEVRKSITPTQVDFSTLPAVSIKLIPESTSIFYFCFQGRL